MDTNTKAKKAEILRMMSGFPSSQSQITEAVISGYLAAVDKCSPDAVRRACGQFLTGKVEGHNNSFMPTAAELSANARAWDEAIATVTASQELRKLERVVSYPIGALPEPPLEPLGPIKVNLGHGDIDLSGKTFAEKEAIIKGEIDTGADKIESFKPPAMKRMTE